MRRLILGIGAIILSVMYFVEPAPAQEIGGLAGSWKLTIEAPQRGGGGGRGDRAGGGSRGGRGDRAGGRSRGGSRGDRAGGRSRGGSGGGSGGGRRGGRLGGSDQILVFSVNDGVLEGAIESERGNGELRDIVIEGSKITFTVTRETRRGSFEATYTGEIDGDTMKGTMEAGGGRFTTKWKATREKT